GMSATVDKRPATQVPPITVSAAGCPFAVVRWSLVVQKPQRVYSHWQIVRFGLLSAAAAWAATDAGTLNICPSCPVSGTPLAVETGFPVEWWAACALKVS